MDVMCSICGLDYTSVKLTTMQAFTRAKLNSAQGETITICEHCKAEMLKGNHPESVTNGEASVDQPGFIKPSGTDDKPAVRPQ